MNDAMLICRIEHEGRPRCGLLRGDVVELVEARGGEAMDLAASLVPTGERVPWDGAQVLCPVVPGKIVAVGSNYHDHTVEMGKPIPKEPVLFMKPPSALLPPGGAILRPPGYARVDYEGELAVVVGRPMHRVAEAEALSYLRGYTALNDVTVRDLQKLDGQFTRAKGFDTFCPLGPVLATDLSPLLDGRFRLVTRRNGLQVQDSATDRFIFSLPRLLSFVSHVMTLLPGDVLSTGTPSGVGNLDPGDVLEIELTGLPPLKNHVVAGPPPWQAPG